MIIDVENTPGQQIRINDKFLPDFIYLLQGHGGDAIEVHDIEELILQLQTINAIKMTLTTARLAIAVEQVEQVAKDLKMTPREVVGNWVCHPTVKKQIIDAVNKKYPEDPDADKKP